MIKEMLKQLKSHAPFTIVGAATGIVILLFSRMIPDAAAYKLFYTLHPLHVLLSALVTASMYEIHKCGGFTRKCNIWMLLIIGYLGSIGIATLSDSIIPYIGEVILGMPRTKAHIGFIEEWWLVNPLAVLGIALAYFRPSTKFPHAMHVLLSTWASLFHIIMAGSASLNILSYVAVFGFLFVAVWLPCCVSDIFFPLLFVKKKAELEERKYTLAE